jgi:hypothetical protein
VEVGMRRECRACVVWEEPTMGDSIGDRLLGSYERPERSHRESYNVWSRVCV